MTVRGMRLEMQKIEEKANYCLNCPVKPCSNKGCPLGNNIPSFIKAIKEEDLQFLAESAAADACAPGNPKDASVEDFKELFRKIM